ncbi:dirigent protein 22-like [Impatiens glandulifera]|uniref:dirigent protein 22-like n=1 Tax=Impatiens glandulifera TaxID=253017 RepID=UPI001FB08DB8|nr:dirigent protein 22-like [Impatiens glandulifera]
MHIFILITILFVSNFSVAKKAKILHVEFYLHDIVGGSNRSAVQVAGQSSNVTGLNPITSMFGSVFVMDNALTSTPSLNSTLVGRAQGLYAMASQHNEFSLLMTLTFHFIQESYNGSSFSVVGRNPVMSEIREMPIVGGTGVFRMARGYCLAKTYSMDQMDAVVGYNVTIFL